MVSYSHSTGTIVGKGGLEIFYQKYEVANPKAILVISHGLGEHSGRYLNIINKLENDNISIYALDHRGHGKSGGERGHIDSITDYIDDLKTFIDFTKTENKKVPFILLGHSMGGTIAFRYSLTHPESIDGLILSAAGLIPAVKVPGWKKGMANMLSKYIPKLTMANGLPLDGLSHDKDVIKAYEDDPLVHDRVTARWYTEFTATGEYCLNRASELQIPLLIFHGSADPLVDVEGSKIAFEKATSRNKKLEIFDGLYHETMNETENEPVLKMVKDWILKTFNLKKSTETKKAVKKKAAAKKKSNSKSTTKKKVSAKKSASKKSTTKKTSSKKKSTAKKKKK